MENDLGKLLRKSHIKIIPIDEELIQALTLLGVDLNHDEHDSGATEHVRYIHPIARLPDHFLHRQTIEGNIVYMLRSPQGVQGSYHYSPSTKRGTLINGEVRLDDVDPIKALTHMIYSARGISHPEPFDFDHPFPSVSYSDISGM